MSVEALQTAESLLREWERARDLSGTVLVTEDGQTLLEACFGHADRANRVPVTPATRFGLASVTKMFTAVATVDLVAQGRLELTTRIVDVLPEPRRPTTLSPEVTVHHLLCHSSGIADYFEEEPPDGSDETDYADLWVQRPSYSMQRPLDFLPIFAELAPYWPPGEKYWYSNAGYILLGLVIEEVTGRPYVEVVQERVFDRAGMAGSGFFRLDEVLPDIALGYVPGPDGSWRTNHFSVPVVGGADGGALSTARDLDRFLTSYDDGTLLGDLHDVVLQPHVDAGDGYFEGYGVHLYPHGPFGHGGGDPGVDVRVQRWPDQRANFVVLANTEGLAGEVRDLVEEAWLA
jgi:CubicO group peptidase (beta-lactamase class C family)